MVSIFKYISTIFLILIVKVALFAQVSSSTALDPVVQPNYEGTNPLTLFVFQTNSSSEKPGTVTVSSAISTNFEWTKFSDVTNDFTITIKTDNNVTSSEINSVEEGGYKIVSTAESKTYYIWIKNVYAPDVFKITLADNYPIHNCDESNFKYTIEYLKDIKQYKKIGGAVEDFNILYVNSYKIFKDGDEVTSATITPSVNSVNATVYKEDMLFEDETNFKLQAKIEFGIILDSEEKAVTSILPYAEFSIDPLQTTIGSTEENRNLDYSKSYNYDKLYWIFYNDKTILENLNIDKKPGEVPPRDSLIQGGIVQGDTIRTQLDTYKYDNSGEYRIKLIAINNTKNCISEFEVDKVIADSSKISVPNVITPNGDNINDVFYAVSQSIKKFEMIITNRWGNILFETKDPYKGWDGKVNGNYVATGVYFYFISAEGAEIKGRKYKLKGAFHVFTD